MDALERLEGLLVDRGVEHVFRLGDTLLWEAGEQNYMASTEPPFIGEGMVLVHNLTPEQAAMATLGAEGCPMAMSGLMRCEAPCGGS